MTPEDILKHALSSKGLSLNTDSRFLDAKAAGPIPSDFGEHLPIPEEAVVIETVGSDDMGLLHAHEDRQ